MRVAHIICTFPPYKGGMGNSVYHAALQLSQRGHESVIFTPAYPGLKAGTEILGPNTKVVRLKPLLTWGNAAVLPQLFYLLKNFDIIHLHYPFYGSSDILILLALLRRIKLVIHYHMDSVGTGFKGLFFKFYAFCFLPILVRLAAKITCASLDYVKHSQLGDFYINHQSKFIEIPFGVDLNRFAPQDKSHDSFILFVGGLDKQHYFKGVAQLIEAFSKILPSNPKTKLVLIGRGDLEKHYYDLAYQHGISKNFQIINSASDEDLAQWYCQSRVLILPSVNKSEAFGLVLLEAMACATPVIASNLPGVRNVFKNKEHGFLVKPGDVDALVEKINYLLNHADQAEAMGLAARHYIRERYSWEKVGERLETMYFRILYVPEKIS